MAAGRAGQIADHGCLPGFPVPPAALPRYSHGPALVPPAVPPRVGVTGLPGRRDSPADFGVTRLACVNAYPVSHILLPKIDRSLRIATGYEAYCYWLSHGGIGAANAGHTDADTAA
jgi:hypothetical protein